MFWFDCDIIADQMPDLNLFKYEEKRHYFRLIVLKYNALKKSCFKIVEKASEDIFDL